MYQSHYTQELLELKDVIVTKVEKTENAKIIHLELRRKMHVCPVCGKHSNRVHDYRYQSIKDISILGNPTLLRLRKRRYQCPECGKRIPESNDFVNRYQRMTSRLRVYMIHLFSQMRSGTSIARECNVSVTTALRAFDQVNYPRPHLPPTISIDEFKGNAGGHKFQCILSNPKKKMILDILESRKLENLCEYFNGFDRCDKNNVKYIVMDMSGEFRSMARTIFPKAKIVVDKFHVCRLVTWALERTRIQAQKEFAPERRKYFKKSRWILLKNRKALKKEEEEQLEVMLTISPEIQKAYLLKEKFYEFMKSPDVRTARHRLKAWNMMAQIMQLPEFDKVVNTLCKWSKEILAAFETGLSNGFTEGMNNRTKVLKRTCYGVRNFKRFRNRILYLETTAPKKKQRRKSV